AMHTAGRQTETGGSLRGSCSWDKSVVGILESCCSLRATTLAVVDGTHWGGTLRAGSFLVCSAAGAAEPFAGPVTPGGGPMGTGSGTGASRGIGSVVGGEYASAPEGVTSPVPGRTDGALS